MSFGKLSSHSSNEIYGERREPQSALGSEGISVVTDTTENWVCIYAAKGYRNQQNHVVAANAGNYFIFSNCHGEQTF